MDDFAAFVGFPSFRKRREHCEMDDFAAFVVFPSFRQLSATGNPENPEGTERPEEARKRPKRGQKRPGRGRGQGPKRPGIQNLVKNYSKRNVL